MNHQPNSYGTNRDNKRNIYHVTIGILTVCLLSIAACSTPEPPINEEEEEEGFQDTIEDWPESRAITTPSDSVRPITYQDSIRLDITPYA